MCHEHINFKICGIIQVVLAGFKKEFKKMKWERKNGITLNNKTIPKQTNKQIQTLVLADVCLFAWFGFLFVGLVLKSS